MSTSLLEWRDVFSLGIPEIDHEHRAMIAEINRLHDELAHDAPATEVIDCLGEILAHIAAHFALEEKNMRAVKYPDYPEHKSDHERLLDELQEMCADLAERGRYEPSILATRLDAWFMQHFGSHDAKLHRALGALR